MDGAKLEHALNAEVVNHATGAVGFDDRERDFYFNTMRREFAPPGEPAKCYSD